MYRLNKIFFLIIAGLLFMAGCKKDEELQGEKQIDWETLPGESIFHLESRWANQEGDSIPLARLYGKPFVLAMIYTHCSYACPRIMADLKQIAQDIPEEQRDEVHFLLITIDPERDTPDTLKAFMDEQDLSPARWTALTGSEDAISEVAAVIGFKYQRSSAMEFAHSNLITLFNEEGVQVKQIEGFGADKSDFVQAIINTINHENH